LTGWPVARLGAVTVKIGSGATPRGGASVYVDEGPAFIRSQTIYDHSFSVEGLVRLSADAALALRGVTVEPNDVLVCITGESVTRTALVPEWVLPARVSQHVAIVRANSEVLVPRYLEKYLLSPRVKAELNRLSEAGATRRALTKGHLQALEIPMPPLDEQRRIADVLGAVDDLIDENERQIGRIARLNAELYRRALGRDEPRVSPFLDVFAVEFGGAFKGEFFTDAGVGLPLLRIRDLQTGSPNIWTTERLPSEVLVTAGDILFGMDAEFRASQWVGPPALLNQRVCRASARAASNAFALEALKAPLAYIEGHKTGTTVIHLNKRDLAETSVTVPSGPAVAEFDAVAEPLRLRSVSLSSENEQLRRTRDELLPLLISGTVHVRPAEVAA
jgi:type I restriction enzyme S subunit